MLLKNKIIATLLIVVSQAILFSQNSIAAEQKPNPRAKYIRDNYTKFEYEIPMRDGKTLFTVVYSPNEPSSKQYPMLMLRTPYSVGPYGADKYRSRLGPSASFEKDKFIFVYQDVRGRFRSEGEYVNMRPQDAYKRGKGAVDDATDTYDTIDWLVKNVPNNNGKVGMWGVSYPGYYTSVASINSHKALKAISPQAPIADWFYDDFHRNGAFILPMAFVFFDRFDNFPEGKHNIWPEGMDYPTHDGYQFFMDLGPLSNVNKNYFNGERPFWNDLAEHPNYDKFWQDRDLLQHLTNTKPATLVVGGWYDTEDLYGPLATYQTMSKKNKKKNVSLVMGPWSHGQWNSTKTDAMGEAKFGFQTGEWFQKNILLPFFKTHLKGSKGKVAKATVFETGADRWRQFAQWPPKNTKSKTLFLGGNESLSFTQNQSQQEYSEYISDPNKPVPHSAKIGRGWDRPYMVEDQRFASRRPDVLKFETEVLTEDLTLAGELVVDLHVATDKTAADFIVKVVDVFPGKDPNSGKLDRAEGNRHELVRWGSIRGRFRESMSKPIPFKPNEVTQVKFDLYDVFHTFKRGHKLQILVQSSMFPFIDRNPQTYVDNIFEAKQSDFVKANHRVYHSDKHQSSIKILVLD
ncbi:MAG: CocE/NonD family hydrolase [Kangiellaceae bacterium]|jgi:putative CocE/NonD family hydrolase|nr:CocE/NonD family hydrolase [Kangiellaceae bacterium]